MFNLNISSIHANEVYLLVRFVGMGKMGSEQTLLVPLHCQYRLRIF